MSVATYVGVVMLRQLYQQPKITISASNLDRTGCIIIKQYIRIEDDFYSSTAFCSAVQLNSHHFANNIIIMSLTTIIKIITRGTTGFRISSMVAKILESGILTFINFLVNLVFIRKLLIT